MKTNIGRTIFIQSNVRVYTGSAVLELPETTRYAFAVQIYEALGEGKARGHMHQPALKEIIDGMDQGRFVLSVEQTEDGTSCLIATSHIRNSKSGPGKELGGVLSLRKGHGVLVVHEGVWLAQQHGAYSIEALVAKTNAAGQGFFSKLEGAMSIGERPSNYVMDKDGMPVMMTVFALHTITMKRRSYENEKVVA